MKINDHLFSVGVLNPTLRVFDIIMATGYGTSYNSFLIKGSDKTALIDASHESYKDTYVKNIEKYGSVTDIDYLVVNHTEPDHSGAVAHLLDLNPELVIYGTAATIKNLEAITQREFSHITVKDGDQLSLGNLTLTFLVSPNIHWPDTMMTWLQEDQVLFSCDFLGAHFAEPTMYVQNDKLKDLYDHEFKYYHDAIMGPFPNFVLRALKKIEDLEFEMVCPSHGPFLLKDQAKEAMKKYEEWNTPVARDKKRVAIFYVSAYGYTREMARHLAAKLESAGLDVYKADIIKTDETELAAHLEDDALLFGSPTINRAALKPVWDVISSIDAVGAQGKPYATFGCYGWSGEAVAQLNDRLNGIKMKAVGDSVRSRFAPTEEVYRQLDELAQQVVDSLK